MKRNKSLLPIVGNETMYNVEHRLSNKTDNEFYRQEIKQIRKENPLIAKFINLWASDENTPKKARGYIAFCGILVYRMLASQAEADKLEEEIGT